MSGGDEPTRRFLGVRASWLVGALAVAALAAITINATHAGRPGAGGLPPGAQLPAFAVPLAQSDIVCDDDRDPCDANVATRASAGQAAGSRPACEVRGAQVLNICALTERGPLVLAFLVTRGADCAATLDPLDDLAQRHPGVQVAVVAIRGDLDELRAVVRARRWRFPVGWDRDGILANLYGVAVCPHVTIASWRGRAQSTIHGDLAPAELDRRIDAAVRQSRRAGWRPPPAQEHEHRPVARTTLRSSAAAP